MRPNWLLVAPLAAACLSAAPSVRADDVSQAGKAPTEAKKEQPTTRIERARIVVKQLEDAIARARAAQPVDILILQPLLTALDQAKALAKPATPAELTAEEKKAVVDEAKKDGPGDAGKGGGPGQDWVDKQMAKAFEGVELNEEEQIKATKIIGDWFKEFQASMADSKKSSDIKRKRDDDLEKAIGHKKANKVINNLNAMRPRGW